MQQRIKLSAIETCAGTQTRVAINEDVVAEYAEAMTGGAEFPPVVVFHDSTTYYLADGFHRTLAATRIKLKEIDADVHKGTKQDALIYSLGANQTHGLPRTNKDKRQCVTIALREFADWSDRRIAEVCGVGHQLVGSIRAEVDESSTCPTPYTLKDAPVEPQTRTGKDGKQYPIPAPYPVKPFDGRLTAEKQPTNPKPPCSGMQYANMAIWQLEKINHNDTQRQQALNHVANWIANQLKG